MANQKDFTADEKKVFGDFKVADDDTGLKNLISAQRKLNGALCQAIWATLDALENQVMGKDPFIQGRSTAEAIKDARKLTHKVAEEPPGCDPLSPIPPRSK